jgi:glutaminyl-tRNA synthetase
MYDFAHGESDYIEQISHSICTLEFVMHRELYNWFLDQIYNETKVRPRQYEFARLNLNYTVMSKKATTAGAGKRG